MTEMCGGKKESVDVSSYKYIASCVLSKNYPDISASALDYVEKRGIQIMRCCVPDYKVKEFEDVMQPSIADRWKSYPYYIPYKEGDTIVSACHNCTNIFSEVHPDVDVISIYELIARDENFVYPDYHGREMTLQDCWRAKDHDEEKKAVRELLRRMNIKVVEMEDDEDFCGISLLRPQPARNPKMAPLHYGPEQTVGKFGTYTPEEQAAIMREHGKKIPTDEVVCYCHYCLEGLRLSGKKSFHVLELLF